MSDRRATRLAGLAFAAAVAALVAVVADGGTTHARQNAPPAAGQQRPPVFRGGATFVTVDAYPRIDDRFVDGLRKEDFQVFEDGKPQSVETFELIRIAPLTPDAERRDPNSVDEANRLAADPHNRLFVVYLDVFHTSLFGSHASRRPVIDFLQRAIGPTDLFGVLTPEVPATRLTFARRLETLEAELAKYWTWGDDQRTADPDALIFLRTPAEQRLAVCMQARPGGASNALVRRVVLLNREDVFFTSLEELIDRLAGVRDERKNVLMLTGTFNPLPRQDDLMRLLTNEVPAVGVDLTGRIGMGSTRDQRQGVPDSSGCNAELSRLASIDFEQRFRELLRRANRANVSFFPIDTEGLRVNGRGTDTLRTLAENTDGVAVVDANDIDVRMKAVADDLSAFYLLGYYSSNTAADGGYRRIEVKVPGQPRVKVSARRGYLAPTAAMRAAAEAGRPVATGPTPVDLALGTLARLASDPDLFVAGGLAGDELAIAVELSGRQMAQGSWAAGADVTVDVSGAGGPAVASVTARIEPGARSVLLRVPAKGSVGPWRVAAKVANAARTLDERVELAVPATTMLGAPVVSRATPSPRAPLRAVADLQFRRTERVHVEWPALQPIEQQTARLLDRRGQPLAVPVTVTTRDADGRMVVVADVLLNALSEGDYVIELVAGRGTEAERAFVAFRLVR